MMMRRWRSLRVCRRLRLRLRKRLVFLCRSIFLWKISFRKIGLKCPYCLSWRPRGKCRLIQWVPILITTILKRSTFQGYCFWISIGLWTKFISTFSWSSLTFLKLKRLMKMKLIMKNMQLCCNFWTQVRSWYQQCSKMRPLTSLSLLMLWTLIRTITTSSIAESANKRTAITAPCQFQKASRWGSSWMK